MANRRSQKVARVIRDSVSETIQQHLSDPRLTGFISITGVDVAPDMKTALVSLSILASDDEARQASFQAVQHAAGVIQRHLGQALTSRHCPHLRFELDSTMQKTLRTLELIEQASREYREKDKEHDTDDELGNTDNEPDGNDDRN
ncbi:MAG: 30S ribosome-binding factor RbfA [Sedimentisphaerales bacterium]|nr:30S ribosome-binding factor RbfA [Sedimentisphaerales bacterium]